VQIKNKPIAEVVTTTSSTTRENTPVTPHQTQPVEKITEENTPNMSYNGDEGDPNFLHGDWIRVERKKRGNKLNSSTVNGIRFPTYLQHQSKVQNKPNMEHDNRTQFNASQRFEYSHAGPNQKSKRKF
jgi:hypothetical protein